MEHGDYGPPKSMASGTGIGNKSQKRALEAFDLNDGLVRRIRKRKDMVIAGQLFPN
jgi:hypothetical protein